MPCMVGTMFSAGRTRGKGFFGTFMHGMVIAFMDHVPAPQFVWSPPEVTELLPLAGARVWCPAAKPARERAATCGQSFRNIPCAAVKRPFRRLRDPGAQR